MENSNIILSYSFTAIAIIVSALIGFLGSKYLESKKEIVIENKLKKSLFSELLHILEHYSYYKHNVIINESNIIQQWDIRKDLIFSHYGDFLSATKFDEYGFLSEEEIKNLLVLSFRIRNTDNLIKLIMHQKKEISTSIFKEVQNRKQFIYNSADGILNFMLKENKEYKNIYDKLKKKKN